MHPETTERRTCDVLVVGSGAAGLRAAIAAHDAGRDVLVVGRRPLRDAHTALAAGGINAALGTRDPEDSWQQHFADTVREAYFLADPRAVKVLAREAPAAIEELERWGCPFTRTPEGAIDQRYFGAHTYRRTCYAGDATGGAVLDAVADRAGALGIEILDGPVVTRLLVGDGGCFGAYAFDPARGAGTAVIARAVVLAVGGHTRLWRRSSSRAGENTGDGIALGLLAGCRVADAELVQFHPTGMVEPEELEGTLVTEAMRGEGGELRNRGGERFMERYDPERLELSTRDIVARAVYTEVAEGRGTDRGGVWLDVSHLDPPIVEEKLARMRAQFRDAQDVDIAEQAVEVAPIAHYSMGGVVVEPEDHSSDIEGLFAAGECTAGVHGANRLGGNSLVETLVFGRRAGTAAAHLAAGRGAPPEDAAAIGAAAEEVAGIGSGEGQPAPEILGEIRDVLWRDCGVVRDGDGLARGLDALAALREAEADVAAPPGAEPGEAVVGALDVRNALLSAEASLRAAAARAESRGAHFRSDHPDVDDSLRANLVLERRDGGLTLDRKPVAPIPDELVEWVSATEEVDPAGRLVE